MLVDLSNEDLALLCEALDSHLYWQVNEDHSRRNSGYVMPPYTNEEAEVMALEERLSALIPKGEHA
jgi:hypothetical protein